MSESLLHQQPTHHDPDEARARRRMGWFVLIFLALAFLASIAAVAITRNPLLLGLPGSLLLTLRPVIRWLFSDRPSAAPGPGHVPRNVWPRGTSPPAEAPESPETLYERGLREVE